MTHRLARIGDLILVNGSIFQVTDLTEELLWLATHSRFVAEQNMTLRMGPAGSIKPPSPPCGGGQQ